MKKYLLLAGMFSLLFTPAVLADVDPEGVDPATENAEAIVKFQDGASYQIYTYSDGNAIGTTKYYLTADGYLTDDPAKAGAFTVKLSKLTINVPYGNIDVTACAFNTLFTAPSLDEEGEINAIGHLVISAADARPDWDAQVFFLGNSGNFAIRATAANSVTGGADTYWTATDYDADGTPEAEYRDTPSYIWKIAGATDVTELIDLKDAIDNVNNIVKKREGVGTELFMRSEADVETLAAAVEAAREVAADPAATVEQLKAALETLNAAVKTWEKAATLPEAGKAYHVKQVSSGRYLSLNQGTKLAAQGAELYFVAGEDGVAITNKEEYVASNADGTMAASTEPYYWYVSRKANGYYTIAKATNHNLVISSEATTAGSDCVANKVEDANSYWTIEKNDPGENLAQAIIDSRDQIGETGELFQHTVEQAAELEKAIDEAGSILDDPQSTNQQIKDAIASLEEAVKTYNASEVIPPLTNGQTYTIQLNGTDLYLSLAKAATIEEEPTHFIFQTTPYKGRYYLRDENKQLYLSMAGTDNWNMSNLRTQRIALAFEYSDGAYHIITQQAAPNNYIGVDLTDP